jgi:outer membrane protein
MQNKFLKFGFWIMLFALLFSISFLLISKRSKSSQIVFVRLEYVFNHFALTKEVKREVIKEQNFRKSILDSMEMNLKIMKKNLINGRFNKDLLKEQYLIELQTYNEKKLEFSEVDKESERKYEEELWNRINEDIQKFGEQNSYEIILGAKGDGNIMYASSQIDITEQVLNYINQKYEAR